MSVNFPPPPDRARPPDIVRRLEGIALLAEHASNIVKAVAGGVDLYVVRADVAGMERGLAILQDFDTKHCSACGVAWEPRHMHVGEHAWV
jgi:hypothetical protein